MYIIIHTRVAHWAQAQFTLLTAYSVLCTELALSCLHIKTIYCTNYRHAHTITQIHIIHLVSVFIFSISIKMDILFGFWIMGVDLFQASFGRRE